MLYLIEISVIEFVWTFILLKIQFIDIFRSKFKLFKCVARSKNDLNFFLNRHQWILLFREHLCILTHMRMCVADYRANIGCFLLLFPFFHFSHLNFFITVRMYLNFIDSFFFSLQTKNQHSVMWSRVNSLVACDLIDWSMKTSNTCIIRRIAFKRVHLMTSVYHTIKTTRQ